MWASSGARTLLSLWVKATDIDKVKIAISQTSTAFYPDFVAKIILNHIIRRL